MGKKILVVDDEADVAKLLKIRLEGHQFEVVLASDGNEGLDKAEAEKPDLILLDVMMPTMDGYTFVREMKSNPNTKDIPIIVLTAKPGMKDLFEMEGARDYITKPYEIDDLLSKINKHLKQ